MKKYLESWEVKSIMACVVSGIIALICIHFQMPIMAWAIGIFSGILISHIEIPDKEKVEDEQSKEN